MNILRGTVASEAGAKVLRSAGTALPLPPGAAVKDGQALVYGIRPEHLRPTLSETGVGAKVAIVEPTGPDIHIYAELGGHGAGAAEAGQEVCSITQDRLELAPGAAIRLMPMLDRVHLFDQETGRAVHG